jgi:pyrroloquinoline quinone biosynthesis protein B
MSWVLLNASPDLRQQIAHIGCLNPRTEDGLRNSPIKAVVLTNGDVDHIMGLVHMREAQPFAIYATERVLGVIAANSVFNILAAGVVERIPLELERPTTLTGAGVDLGLTVEAFDVPGKIALYLEDWSEGPRLGTRLGDTIGLKVSDEARGQSFYYIPGCAGLDEDLAARIRGASTVFFDGTLYRDDEMIDQGLLDKTGPRMGHISMSGPAGSIAAFRPLGVGRKVFVHINNSNPVLDERSSERAAVEAAGWEVGYDGMEIRL